MARRRNILFRILASAFLLAVVTLAASPLWLRALGRALVTDEGPAKADVAVVLAGDYNGHRILAAAELARAGYVPLVLVSGSAVYYGYNESDLAISYALKKGCPAQWFAPLTSSALSTAEEAPVVLAELARRRVRSFLLVTSSYHTARAARIFRAAGRAMGAAPEMRVVAAPDRFFTADSWWRTREGRKTLFLEWCKTVATLVGA